MKDVKIFWSKYDKFEVFLKSAIRHKKKSYQISEHVSRQQTESKTSHAQSTEEIRMRKKEI